MVVSAVHTAAGATVLVVVVVGIAIVPLVLVQALYWGAAGAVVGLLGRRGVRHPAIPAAAWC